MIWLPDCPVQKRITMLIALIVWVVIGLAVGFITAKVLNLHGDDPRFGIVAAVVGAVVFAAVYNMISDGPVNAWSIWGMLWAAIGGGAATAAWHGIRSRSISHASYTRRSSY